MKKAIIATGGKQYLVAEGETFDVELLPSDETQISLQPLLVIDGDNVQVGAPALDKLAVTLEVVEADHRADKVVAIRYKAKKRVHKVRGHRQHLTQVKVTKIA